MFRDALLLNPGIIISSRLKSAGGIIGLALSTLIFKRKRWAFLLGVGYGVGMAYGACDYEINQKTKLPLCKKK